MGFEELAALKQQLSKRTQAGKSERADARGATDAADAAAPQGRADGARPARRPAPGAHARGAVEPGARRGPRPGGAVPVADSVDADGKPSASVDARGDRAPRGRQDRRGERRNERSNERSPGSPDERGGERAHANARPASNGTSGTASRQDGRRQGTPVDPVVVTIGQLQKRFPKAFPKNPLPKVPLKLGVSKDLIAQAETLALSEAALLEAIKVWCQGIRYWSSMTKDAARVNLAGEAEGIVTPEQASRARSLVATQRRGKRPAAKKATPADASADASVGGAADEAGTDAPSSTLAPASPDASNVSDGALTAPEALGDGSVTPATARATAIADVEEAPALKTDPDRPASV